MRVTEVHLICVLFIHSFNNQISLYLLGRRSIGFSTCSVGLYNSRFMQCLSQLSNFFPKWLVNFLNTVYSTVQLWQAKKSPPIRKAGEITKGELLGPSGFLKTSTCKERAFTESSWSEQTPSWIKQRGTSWPNYPKNNCRTPQ